MWGWQEVRGELRHWGDLVFPRACVSCARVVENGGLRHVCARCEPRIRVVREPCCPCCGHPFFGVVEDDRLCPHCLELDAAFAQGATVVLAKGAARDLIHAFKYRGLKLVMEDVAALARRAERVMNLIHGAVLVPVPLHPRKFRERGYNQTELLAEALKMAADGCCNVEKLLIRVVDTKTQTIYGREARQANLKNAFALRPGAVIKGDLHYILVDDVFTTGSTLNSCAGELRRAGCLNLDVVTFGHG